MGTKGWIEERIDQYYRYLNFVPWGSFEAEQRKKRRDSGVEEDRQTGKTTRGLLYAIAQAERNNMNVVVVGAGSHHTSVLQVCGASLVSRLVGLLGRNVEVFKSSVNPSVVYVDHLAGGPSLRP